MPKQSTVQITPRQLEVLRLVAQFQASQCYSATIGELAEKLGVSRPTVFEHLAGLREKNLLENSPGRARSLKVTRQGNRLLEKASEPQGYCEMNEGLDQGRTGLCLAGKVAAGMPIEAIENREPISLGLMFGDRGDIFVLEVAGDSMIDEGISDGDYIICRKALAAHDGQLVVAIVDDENATLKRFYKEKNRARLEPANDAYAPIYSDNCRIEAVALGLVRRF